MGNDGGTIAKRLDIISLHKELQGKSTVSGILDQQGPVCTVSSLSLQDEVVVVDYLGRLYIKEKIIQDILSAKAANAARDVSSPSLLLDLVDVKLAWQNELIVCPLTSRKDICFLRTCGCGVSYKLLKELRKGGDASFECPNCSVPFTFNYDLVLLSQNDEAAEFNQRNYSHLRDVLRVHHNKKPIREKKRKETKKRSRDCPEEGQKGKKSKKPK